MKQLLLITAIALAIIGSAVAQQREPEQNRVPKQPVQHEEAGQFRGRPLPKERPEPRVRPEKTQVEQNRKDVDVDRNKTDVNVNENRKDVNVEQNRTDVDVNRGAEKHTVVNKTFKTTKRIERPHSDFHFTVGIHPRAYWLERYDVVEIEGCYYYFDGGYYWPAYGFDPSCQYPNQYIVIQAE